MQDITAFNTYYIEQEENFIIRLQSLEEAAEAVETASKEQQTLIQNALADLHGGLCLPDHQVIVKDCWQPLVHCMPPGALHTWQ